MSMGYDETGLATDLLTGELDDTKVSEVERALQVAAARVEPTAEEVAELLELGLYQLLRDMERAHAWVAFIDAHAALDAEEVRSLGERA